MHFGQHTTCNTALLELSLATSKFIPILANFIRAFPSNSHFNDYIYFICLPRPLNIAVELRIEQLYK